MIFLFCYFLNLWFSKGIFFLTIYCSVLMLTLKLKKKIVLQFFLMQGFLMHFNQKKILKKGSKKKIEKEWL